LKQESIGKLLGNIVFAPTGVAYVWAMLGYVAAGLGLYLIFIAGAFKIGLFDRVREWPTISQVALAAGPILMAAGCYFSRIQTDYYMLIPSVIYALLGICGSRALAEKF
jgi:hypothetical protein